MSSSVTIDWQAVREQERRESMALQARLAGLATEHQQLERWHAAAAGVAGKSLVTLGRVDVLGSSATLAELRAAVGEAERSVGDGRRALESESRRLRPRRRGREETHGWAPQIDPEAVSAPRTVPMISTAAGSAPIDRAAHRAEVEAQIAEADAVVLECSVRCPDRDLSRLDERRARLGDDPAGNARELLELRFAAAQLIRQTQHDDEVEAERARLQVLARQAPPAEVAQLRRRVAIAAADELRALAAEVDDAAGRALAAASRDEAVAALSASLADLGYDVGDRFQTFLNDGPASPEGDFVVVPSIHSADHGLRVRASDDQVYVSVVRKAGTGDPAGAVVEDTAVQKQTCADLEAAAAATSEAGLQLLIGNRQSPHAPARLLDAARWPVATAVEEATADMAVDLTERQRQWAAQQAQRPAQQRRPGS